MHKSQENAWKKPPTYENYSILKKKITKLFNFTNIQVIKKKACGHPRLTSET